MSKVRTKSLKSRLVPFAEWVQSTYGHAWDGHGYYHSDGGATSRPYFTVWGLYVDSTTPIYDVAGENYSAYAIYEIDAQGSPTVVGWWSSNEAYDGANFSSDLAQLCAELVANVPHDGDNYTRDRELVPAILDAVRQARKYLKNKRVVTW